MSTTASNTRNSNKGATTPNITAEQGKPLPTTQAGCYASAWETIFSKLPKAEQESLTANLKAPPQIIRGKEVLPSNVNKFVKAVAELGEQFFALKQKQAANEAKDSKSPKLP